MPLQWDRNRNPYTQNAFRILRAGPGVLPVQVVQLTDNLTREIQSGKSIELHGMPITTTEAKNASADLRDAAILAEELLLAHHPLRADDHGIDMTAQLGQLWEFLFSDNVIDEPALAPFSPGRPGDEEDLRHDIVFDGYDA